jgi:hypothetical protein
MGFGNGWWPWRQSGDSTVNYQVYSMRGTGSNLEVANMNDDPYPEIIIEAYTKLIVLDHNGDPETTIDLPLTNAYPWQ